MLIRHILHQKSMITMVVRMTLSVLKGPLRRTRPVPHQLPEPPLTRIFSPLPDDLIDDFIVSMGGDTKHYRDCVPAHLFPQWCFPVVGETIIDLPYSMAKMLNAGCRMEVKGSLPRGKELQVRANIESIDDDGRRAIVLVRVVTGTSDHPETLVCTVSVLFQIKRSGGKSDKEKPCIPEDAKEVDRWRLSRRSGLEFALLTGDFNPVHWVRLYAWLSGFKNVILHGLGTMARTVETLNRCVLDGHPERLHTLELRFTRPLVLPAAPAVYCCEDGTVFVGDMPGKAPCAMGHYTAMEEKNNE